MAAVKPMEFSTGDGVGTLRLDWPGAPVNGWNWPRLTQFESALDSFANRTDFDVLLIRSARPGGFGAGWTSDAFADLRSDDLAARFAAHGQRVLAKLSELPMPTLAFVEGPCLGPAFEMILACDVRVAVDGPSSRVGFGRDPLGWGGRTRWKMLTCRPEPVGASPRDLDGFRAVCCERRSKIELRNSLDTLLANPRKPRPNWRRWLFNAADAFAQERREFTRTRHEFRPVEWSLPGIALPKSIGIVGDGARAQTLIWEAALRGCRVIHLGEDQVIRPLRMTPLEIDNAAARIVRATHVAQLAECTFVIADETSTPPAFLERHLPARTILAVAPADWSSFVELAIHPERVVGLEFAGERMAILQSRDQTWADDNAAAWLKRLGFEPVASHEVAKRFEYSNSVSV